MRKITVAVAMLVFCAVGYASHKADLAASNRAEFLTGPIVEDADTSVGLSAGGFLNRDVSVSAYTFAERNRAVEDHWLEELSHGDSADALYKRGFRRIRKAQMTLILDDDQTRQTWF